MPRFAALAAYYRELAAKADTAEYGNHDSWQVLRRFALWRCGMLVRTFIQHQGHKVFSGPFTGMEYPVQATEGALCPRLLGCYESELHPHIAALVAEGVDTIIDVGCAEGYYAVGFARLDPGIRVFAHDIDPAARAACENLARINEVGDRVIVGGEVKPAELLVSDPSRTLLWLDIEGCEDQFLDPASAPILQSLKIIVETHPGLCAGITERLQKRFAATHDIIVVREAMQHKPLPDWLGELDHLDRLLATWEYRASPTPWLVMRPKRSTV